MRHVVMIGFSVALLTRLDKLLEPRSITVIEEPDLYEARSLAARAEQLACIRSVELARYQQADGYRAVGAAVHARQPVSAVLGGLEYAVEPAAVLAEDFGLPGLSANAARILRDKLKLRAAARRHGLLSPDWREVTGPGDIAAFAAGRDVVVKPANRQASLGVLLLDAGEDPVAAWEEMTAADEGVFIARRPMQWRYLVEERLVGAEYSAEALIREGDLLFLNLTAKTVFPGRHPVELGHIVPAPLDAADRASLQLAMERLVRAVGARDGVLHAEWMLTREGPALIECAGRMPGDGIFDLIDLAYETDMHGLLLALACGEPLVAPGTATKVAEVRFLAPLGRVESVTGAEEAAARDGVTAIHLTAQPGDVLRPPRSSWDRAGHVVVVGETLARTRLALTGALETLTIATQTTTDGMS